MVDLGEPSAQRPAHMAARVSAFDWATTPIGADSAWSAELRAVVRVVLASPLPTVLLWGPELTQIYNDGYAALVCERRPTPLGRPGRECWPEAWHLNEPIYAHVLKHGKPVLHEDRLFPIARGGRIEEAFFTLAYSPVPDAAGTTRGVMLTVIETTTKVQAAQARDRAESNVRANNERQAFLLRLSDAIRPLADPSRIQIEAMQMLGTHLGVYRAQYWEAAGADGDYLESAGGYTSNDYPQVVKRVRMDDFGQYVKANLRAGLTLAVADVSHDPRVGAAELRMYDSFGFRSFVGVPLVKAGRLVAVLGLQHGPARTWTAEEIALTEETAERTWAAVERAKAEAALRASEEKYRNLFDSMDEGYCIIELIPDEQGNFVDWRYIEVNPAFAKNNGLMNAAGKTIRELTPGIEQKWFDVYGRVARTGEPRRLVEHSAALSRWFDLYTFRVGDPSRHHVAVLFQDVTSQRVAQDTLRKAKEAAEAASHAKDEFLATLSHELRTPLSAVLVWTRLLKPKGEADEDLREGLELIERSAIAQRELVNDLLDTAQITTGVIRLKLAWAALQPIVIEVLDSLAPTAAAKGVTLRRELAEDVGIAQIDAGRIRQVLWNLIGNAIKFTHAEGRVTVALLQLDRTIRIVVSDTGLGIDSAFLPHIFERFRQADPAPGRGAGGLGLGLAIAKQLVELHGGTITAESDGSGRGSTFTVDLPLAASNESIPNDPSDEADCAT